MTDTYEYRTRTNGDVELIRAGALAKLLSGEEAERFMAQVKDGDEQQVVEQFAGERPDERAGSQDQGHPELDDPLPGPTPHGDGAVREKDGQDNPSE